MRQVTLLYGLAIWLAAAAASHAGTPPDAKCQAGKNTAAGKYAACRQAAKGKLAAEVGTCSVTTAMVCYRDAQCPGGEICVKDTEKYDDAIAKCSAKLAKKWQKLTDKAAEDGSTCPEDPLPLADFQGAVDAHSDNIAAGLAGDGLRTCGDGVIGSGEQCDLGTLGGASCASLYSGTQGTLVCTIACMFSVEACLGTIDLHLPHTLGDTTAAEAQVAAARTGNDIMMVDFVLTFDEQPIMVSVGAGSFATADALRSHIQGAVDTALNDAGEVPGSILVSLGGSDEILFGLPPLTGTSTAESAIAAGRSGNSIAAVNFNFTYRGTPVAVSVASGSFTNPELLRAHIQSAVDTGMIAAGAGAAGDVIVGY